MRAMVLSSKRAMGPFGANNRLALGNCLESFPNTRDSKHIDTRGDETNMCGHLSFYLHCLACEFMCVYCTLRKRERARA